MNAQKKEENVNKRVKNQEEKKNYKLYHFSIPLKTGSF